MAKLSVIIITFNEENNIARAIKSVLFADEVIIVDSFSCDKTVQIATDLGAKIFQQKFLGFGAQKEYATSLCQNDWILSLDADEEVTLNLKSEISNVISLDKKVIYSIGRKTYFLNKWIKYGGWYPDRVNRLYQKNIAKWTYNKVHEELLPVDSKTSIVCLSSDLNHYSFPTFTSQINTNIKYAKLGALALIEKKKKNNMFLILLKPFGKFLECYFLKLGFLDGKEGLLIAINASYSMFMKYTFASLNEIKPVKTYQ